MIAALVLLLNLLLAVLIVWVGLYVAKMLELPEPALVIWKLILAILFLIWCTQLFVHGAVITFPY